MVIKSLNDGGYITCTGSFGDGSYFKLNEHSRKKVDKVAEETFISTEFLSLTFDKLHSAIKGEE